MNSEKLLLEVKAAMPTTNGCAVFLGNELKTFVIYVDHGIGNVISMTMNEEKKVRPLTHDLIRSIFVGFEIELKYILINNVDNGTYYARIYLQMANELGKKIVEIDSRPSDALVLALQKKCPIYVTREVLDKTEDMSEVLERVLNNDL